MQPYKLRPYAEYSEQLCHSEERLIDTGEVQEREPENGEGNTDTFSTGQKVSCLAKADVVSEGNKGKHWGGRAMQDKGYYSENK